MDNIQFTDEEIKYINSDINDQTQNIHRRLNTINDIFYLYANLPKGTYILEISYHSDFCNQLEYFNIPSWITSNKYVHFIISKENENKRLFLAVDNIDHHIKSLRKQVVLNQREKERLIQKSIKSHTDLGEEYNRNSFEDTILDYFNDDEDLVVDLTKSPKDKDVKYLQLMKLMQDKNRYEIKQQKLDMEACELAIREQNLMKY